MNGNTENPIVNLTAWLLFNSMWMKGASAQCKLQNVSIISFIVIHCAFSHSWIRAFYQIQLFRLYSIGYSYKIIIWIFITLVSTHSVSKRTEKERHLKWKRQNVYLIFFSHTNIITWRWQHLRWIDINDNHSYRQLFFNHHRSCICKFNFAWFLS